MRWVVFALTALVLNGCATVFTSSTSNVRVQVVDSSNNQLLQNVTCSVMDGEGMVYLLSSNPGSILVPKGKGTLRVDCKKSGYVQQNMGVAETINGVTFVNVLFWPRFLVDAVTGSIHKYPSQATIQMKKESE